MTRPPMAPCCWLMLTLTGLAQAFMAALDQECPTAITEYMITTYRIPMGMKHRDFLTTPSGFTVRNSSIPGGGFGVFADTFIPAHTWLGEYEGLPLPEGKMKDETDDSYMWAVFEDQESEKMLHYVDGTDPRTSNWLRYVNCPNRVVDMNVWPHWCYGKVYYRTMKDIYPGQELFIYYGDDYAERLGVSVADFQAFFDSIG